MLRATPVITKGRMKKKGENERVIKEQTRKIKAWSNDKSKHTTFEAVFLYKEFE